MKRSVFARFLIGGAASLLLVTAMPTQAFAANAMPISFNAWEGYNDLRGGEFEQAKLAFHLGRIAVTPERETAVGTWTSDPFTPPLPVNKLVASWQARTPGNSWIETQLQVKLTDGRQSGWYTMSKWAFASTVNPDGSITSQRGFASEQADDIGSVDQDTFWTNDNLFVQSYRVRAVMHSDGQQRPSVSQLAVTAADYLQSAETGTSPTTMRRTIDLPVPQLSQYVHNGEYLQFDNGGPGWCSPTSVSMLLRYWRTGPSQRDIASLPPDPKFDENHRADGDVDYAAFHIFDNGYPEKNTGNWPLNTAYAASFGLDTSVRQYNSLQDIERWIQKGVPVVVTLRWDNKDADPTNNLDGSSIDKTPGHLMVIRGFTANGDVIANDPASPDGNQQVRHVYQRAQMEHLWLKTKHGTVYIIKPHFVH